MEDLFTNEFDKKYCQAYREEKSQPTNPENSFDKAQASVESLTPATQQATSMTDAQVMAKKVTSPPAGSIQLFNNPVMDYISVLLPQGAPVGSRHKTAIKLAYDLLILCDGDVEKVRSLLMHLQWVNDIVTERGQKELDDILEAAKKLKHKRESENLNELLPSRDMRRAIEQVTGRKYSQLVADAYNAMVGHGERKDQVIEMLERIGREIEKLFPHYSLIRLLCYRLKRRHYIAALLVGGAFFMTLMTRCWYISGVEPGRICRLNSILELIGRSGSGKHIAVDFYRLLMEPVKKSDKVQIDALNNWNQEKDMKGGGEKNKTPRPKGIFRCMPSETSAAAIREAEFNAKEMVDGEEWPLHVSHFNSELQDMQRQMRRDYMNIEKLFYKGFHNEPDGSYLKTSNAPVGEYDVHFNGVYSGTQTALDKQTTTENFAGGILFRLTVVPLGDSNFEARERRMYTEEDAARDQQLREWAYRFNDCKGEIPCEDIDIALDNWTKRRMKDAGEEKNFALEDLIKRPYWHGMNYSLPFIVSRHWDEMVEDGGKYKCGPNFKTDKYDRQLALLIENAQFAFQQYFFLSVGEQYYDDLAAKESYRHPHQQKTKLAYARLPEIFSSDDVMREYNYDNMGSTCWRLKSLQDDGMAKKIKSGPDKGKYKKLNS